ncbi:DUF1801 domain-containing protein [Neolewinella aurantiaca]|uniref:DUF1801 domain-containing protein n=1 Tax=Neolewinella aurantiaca TaxID=2602767 RepID=A0A5C7FLT5_9BACT|nr:DUF1801 domain-containing protein [Neolewinella aurantiaca]TXF90999.1 DUF1801 domain-containing protein [Neolewinella aurantiaca]
MAKNEPKTKPTAVNPQTFVAAVEDEQKRADAEWVMAMMEEVTGEPPVMWGPSIIGFGTYHYVYESGREGDWMLTGFSPRKAALSIYLMSGLKQEEEYLAKLGKYKTGKSCLYVKRLSDIDTDVLRAMVVASVAKVRAGEIRY